MPISFTGGVFSAGDVIMDAIRRELSAGETRFEIVEPRCSPRKGAALYAGVLADCPSITRCLERLY